MEQVKELTTPEDKLRAMYRLQKIDSKIDEIRILRGELPIEVQDLEDEIQGLTVRIDNFTEELDALNSFIGKQNENIENARMLIARYEKQQNSVRNNREFDALTKEIEMQNLEIELAKKKIRDTRREIEKKEEVLALTEDKRKQKEADLVIKKEELEQIIKDTKKEEEQLSVHSKHASEVIEERLMKAYARIRRTYRNGLAVVTFERDSCGGCFGKIPPQRQLEIRQRKKIILCEHCGRILVDPHFDVELEKEENL